MHITRLFIHGLESSNQGTKGIFFKKRYPDMIIENFQGTLEQRMKKLSGMLADQDNLILVGSSFGGLMAALYALKNTDKVLKLVLLAPALSIPDFQPFLAHRLTIPVTIIHGQRDDIVPLSDVKEIAKKVFTDLTHTIVDDDHPLTGTFPLLDWDTLLASR